jgi:hypothetical protein
MPPTNVLLLRHSGMREVSEQEVLAELSAEELRASRQVLHVDTQEFKSEIEAGNWYASEQYLVEQASHIRHVADEQGDTELKYFGLAEIPHILALGAFVGDERHVQVFDFDRDRNIWTWPETDQKLLLRLEGLPAERVASSGRVAIRVEISSSIQNADITDVLGADILADIRLRLQDGQPTPMVKTISSAADAQQVRRCLRQILAAISEFRPGTDTIHLFVAAPAPVCFLLGQELRLRNNPPFQTYRYCRQEEVKYQEALLLTARDVEVTVEELTEAQLLRSSHIRSIVWPRALRDVLDYAASKSENAPNEVKSWYQAFPSSRKKYFDEAKPFPALPPLWKVVNTKDTVDLEPYHGEFGHDKSANTWRLNDGLLLGLSQATANNDDELRKLVRLFLYHEYVHDFHSLTKYNATDVGRFPNCLERIDYAADLYALLHELDFASIHNRTSVDSEDKVREFLVATIDLMTRSMWAFDSLGDFNRPQIRRVRRYLNWYWRQVQVSRSPDLATALRVLAKPPTIELAGCRLQIAGRRELMLLDKLDPTTELSIGLVTENERLLRITDSMSTNIGALLQAFRSRDHTAIKVFFEGVFEEALSVRGALPEAE